MVNLITKHFRALLPSWKFFDDLGNDYELWFRLRNEDLVAMSWVKCLERNNKRTLFNLIINTQENIRFAFQTVVEQSIQEIQYLNNYDGYDLTVSYNLLKNIVEREIMEKVIKKNSAYEFKITSKGDDVLVSKEHFI